MSKTFFLKITAGLLALTLAACAPGMPTPQPVILPTAPASAATAPSAAATFAAATTAPDARAVQSSEYGVSLSYAPGLAESAAVESVAPVPLGPERMFAEAHPGYIAVRFSGINLKRPYQLAYPLSDPQVMVYRTADFASYSQQAPNDFPAQQAKLAELLKGDVSGRCMTPPASVEEHLPYLPWTNAGQVFCAQLKTLAFGGANNPGQGIRYLTTYAQGISPVVEGTVFYTFQGLTNDGQYYVSAVFPVETGVFSPDASAGAGVDPAALRKELATQISMLNARGADQFNPALSDLDAMLQSLVIE